MAKVNGLRTIKLRENIKSVRILATGTQFHMSTPANIVLKAVPYNFTAVSYTWYKGTGITMIGDNENLIIAHNQIEAVETFRVVVVDNLNREYEDSISVTKVKDLTDFAKTTVNGGLITTSTLEVGETININGNLVSFAKAGITGAPGSGEGANIFRPRVVFYAGTGFSERENAKFQVWDNGLVIMQNAKITGEVNATSGTIKNIIGDNITVNSGSFKGRIDAPEGKIGGFQIDGEDIKSSMILPVSGAVSNMQLGRGGLKVTYQKGTNVLGEVNINAWDYSQGVGYMARIKANGRESNGTFRVPLLLQGADVALQCDGDVKVQGEVNPNDLLVNNNVRVKDSNLTTRTGITTSIKVRSGGTNPAYYNLTFVSGILISASGSNS